MLRNKEMKVLKDRGDALIQRRQKCIKKCLYCWWNMWFRHKGKKIPSWEVASNNCACFSKVFLCTLTAVDGATTGPNTCQQGDIRAESVGFFCFLWFFFYFNKITYASLKANWEWWQQMMAGLCVTTQQASRLCTEATAGHLCGSGVAAPLTAHLTLLLLGPLWVRTVVQRLALLPRSKRSGVGFLLPWFVFLYGRSLLPFLLRPPKQWTWGDDERVFLHM